MDTNQPTTERNLNFELLRIIAMFMVVMLHVNWFGGLLNGYKPDLYPFPFLICNFFEFFCIIAVNLYVLISGYFLSGKSSPFKLGIFSKCPQNKMAYEMIMVYHLHMPFFIVIFPCILT